MLPTSDDRRSHPATTARAARPASHYFQLRGDTLIYNTVNYMRYPPLVARYPAVSLAESRLSRLHFFGRYTSTSTFPGQRDPLRGM